MSTGPAGREIASASTFGRLGDCPVVDTESEVRNWWFDTT